MCSFLREPIHCTAKTYVRCYVYNGTWQDGVDCVEQTKQFYREPKWLVQISSLQQITMKRVHGVNHSNRAVHTVSTNRYRCICDVNHVRTETGELPTADNADDTPPFRFAHPGPLLQAIPLFDWYLILMEAKFSQTCDHLSRVMKTFCLKVYPKYSGTRAK